MGPRFPRLQRRCIDDLTIVECRDITGPSHEQLKLLLRHLRVPYRLCDKRSRRVFTGEEAFLHYIAYDRLGITKLQLSTFYFGGDPRRLTYSIRVFGRYLYTTFYHKIAGDSMRMWIRRIHEFRYAIWNRVMDTEILELTRNYNQSDLNALRLEVPFESFRVFGFIDDTSQYTTAPGIEARRRYGCIDNIQRAFYSGYFSAHGLKAQVLSLPNGMVGSVFVGSLRVSDAGMLNMSALDTYLRSLFDDFHIVLPHANNMLPVVYGDGVFPALPTVVPRYSDPSPREQRINRILSSVRQNIEHYFGLHYNIFQLFNRPAHFRLLHEGKDAVYLFFNSFLLLNCYNCFNNSLSTFGLRPPTIEEYLPLNEELPIAPIITDRLLGEVYHYRSRSRQ